MDVTLGTAGFLCLALAAGHTAIGVVWVLPGLDVERMPKTPFGPRSLTLAMVRVTWFVVTILVVGLAGVLLTLAVAPDADAETVLLRWFAGAWVATTAMSLWAGGGRGRQVWRFPVPLVWLVVAGLCWAASA
ncbi:MAG TPA: hypothetical protein VEV43_02550 [Actinomycetota bacterium]|nr:hypothetical protein [Actinomycetota bacterium]